MEGEPPLTRFKLVDNILGHGVDGLKFARVPERSEWTPDAVILGNAIVNVDATADQVPSAEYRSSEKSLPYVFFGSRAAAGLEADGRLSAHSPLRKSGTRTTDVGVSFLSLCDAVYPACGTIQAE